MSLLEGGKAHCLSSRKEPRPMAEKVFWVTCSESSFSWTTPVSPEGSETVRKGRDPLGVVIRLRTASAMSCGLGPSSASRLLLTPPKKFWGSDARSPYVASRSSSAPHAALPKKLVPH